VVLFLFELLPSQKILIGFGRAHLDGTTNPERGLQSAAMCEAKQRQPKPTVRTLLRTEVRAPGWWYRQDAPVRPVRASQPTATWLGMAIAAFGLCGQFMIGWVGGVS